VAVSLLVEETTNLSQITDKLYHIMVTYRQVYTVYYILYILFWKLVNFHT